MSWNFSTQIQGFKGHIQCLLVDEIQDCIPEEIEVLCRCATNVCLAGDKGQRIFSPHSIIDDLEKRMKVIRLKTHYRIGHEMSRVADIVGKAAGLPPIEDNCNYRDAEANFTLFRARTMGNR